MTTELQAHRKTINPSGGPRSLGDVALSKNVVTEYGLPIGAERLGNALERLGNIAWRTALLSRRLNYLTKGGMHAELHSRTTARLAENDQRSLW